MLSKNKKFVKVECDDLVHLVQAVAGGIKAQGHVLSKQCVIPGFEPRFLRLDFGYDHGKDKAGYFMMTVNEHGIQVTQYDHEQSDGLTVLSWEWQRTIKKPKARR
jgi:hypothetical protein